MCVLAPSQTRSGGGPWTKLDYSRASTSEKEDRLKVIRKAKVRPQYHVSPHLQTWRAAQYVGLILGLEAEQALDVSHSIQLLEEAFYSAELSELTAGGLTMPI